MIQKNALEILHEAEHNNGLENAGSEQIQEVFISIIYLDGCSMVQQAEKALKEIDLDMLKESNFDEDDFKHRLMMDVFNESMLDFLEKKSPLVESSVEHDIESWIDGHAEIITSANIKKIEKYLVSDGTPLSDKDLIHFHNKINFSVLESFQNESLQKTWKLIESNLNGI